MKHLHIVYILPSRYDDDGHVFRFWRGILPSNTLACLKSLTNEVADKKALGDDVRITVESYDDTVQKIPYKKILKKAQEPGTQLLVGMVGVQSNQYPRGLDLAKQFRADGIPVMIGGFHVSGVLAMNGEPTRDLQEALDAGITLVRGEAEAPGVLEGILSDALHGRMKPIYDITETPDIHDAAVPQPDTEYLQHFVTKSMGTIDTSRGCPFNCSFCTIINVQGRKMRHRSAKCILETIRSNYERGITFYFFTDDNLARSPVWEELFDGLIAMRETGMNIGFMMQVDTQSYKLPNFVDKASRAGCYQAFIGLETINEDNIAATGKRQNKVGQFAEMAQRWREAEILIHTGFIIGLPHDTVDSIRRDIATLKDSIKVDQASFFMLTPLPGSRDHTNMVKDKTPIDADLNNLDSFHETFRHPRIAPGEWYKLYREAWDSFYSVENMTNIMLRMPPSRYWRMFGLLLWYRYSSVAGTHPMVTGFGRLKERKARRPIFGVESVPRYAWRRVKDVAWAAKAYTQLFWEFQEVWLLSRRPSAPQWAALAHLRETWLTVRRRVDESALAGRYDEGMLEIRTLLSEASQRMHKLSQEDKGLSRSARKKLKEKAHEIDAYFRDFELQKPTWDDLVKAQRYIREGLISWYEELAIGYVGLRRRLNTFWRRQLTLLKSGRFWKLNFLSLPKAILSEAVISYRFAVEGLCRVVKTAPPQEEGERA